MKNDSLYTNIESTWDSDNGNELKFKVSPQLNVSQEFPNWYKKINSNSYLSGSQKDFFEPEKTFLKKCGIGSILLYVIKIENKIHGMIILESRDKNKIWENYELIFMKTIVAGIEKVIEKNIMNQRLENSKTSYMELFFKSSSGIVIFNENSFIENINPTAQRFFNKDTGIIGKPVDVLTSDKKIINLIMDAIRYCNTNLLSRNLDVIIENNSDCLVLDLFFSRLKYFDKSCVIMYARDITRRYKNEQKVKESLKEKQTLLQEIHHRVKNNLQIISSLLNLQLKDIECEKDRKLFIDSQNRIKSIALIHESLYHSGNLSKINFNNYTEKLISRLFTIFHTDYSKIKYSINIPNIVFDLKKAIPCGLILDELITNSLKYAFPNNREGEIFVSLSQVDNKIVLLFKDNGVGFDSSQLIMNKYTLGFELVTTLVLQLKGTYRIIDDKGFGMEIIFPE